MNPDIWGRPTWYSLHLMAEYYSPQPTPLEQQACVQYFMHLGYMLPCVTCRRHCVQYMQQHARELQLAAKNGQKHLVYFVIQFHNDVNRRLGKNIVNEEEAAKWYAKANVNASSSVSTFIRWLFVLLIVCGIGALFYFQILPYLHHFS